MKTIQEQITEIKNNKEGKLNPMMNTQVDFTSNGVLMSTITESNSACKSMIKKMEEVICYDVATPAFLNSVTTDLAKLIINIVDSAIDMDVDFKFDTILSDMKYIDELDVPVADGVEHDAEKESFIAKIASKDTTLMAYSLMKNLCKQDVIVIVDKSMETITSVFNYCKSVNALADYCESVVNEITVREFADYLLETGQSEDKCVGDIDGDITKSEIAVMKENGWTEECDKICGVTEENDPLKK